MALEFSLNISEFGQKMQSQAYRFLSYMITFSETLKIIGKKQDNS